MTVPLQGIDEGAERDHQDGDRVVGGAEVGEGGALAEINKISKEGVTQAVILIEAIIIAARGGEAGVPEILWMGGGGGGEVAILPTEEITTKTRLVQSMLL